VAENDKQHDYLFVVNPPSRNDDRISTESDLKRTNQDELTKVYPGLDYLHVLRDPAKRLPRPVDNAPNDETTIYQPLGTGIARVLCLLVLLCIFVEVILAFAFAHHSEAAPDDVAPALQRGWLRTSLTVAPWVLFGFLAVIAAILIHDARTNDFLGFLPGKM